MHLDPISLKLFISVVEQGTIARAAEHEHIAAAAISKRISELEAHLKTNLLIRTNKGIRPTPAGIALSTMAKRALRELDDISTHMKEYSDGARGFIRVCANISAITQFLPQDIKSFLSAYPNIHVDLQEQVTPAIIKSISENVADVGIFSDTSPEGGIDVFPYREDALALILPASHPLASNASFSFAEALDYDFIGLHKGSAINRIVSNAADDLKRTLKIKVQVTGFDTLCFMVSSELGIGVLPLAIAKRYSKMFGLRAVPIKEPWARRKLLIGVRSFESLPAAARLFIKHLSQESGNTQGRP
ncbi:LysR substrate-binding domain-containing protein [Pollutimonas harenae]|uniref:LysR family transcriptional regulator n=1 Tax=Pollutimonas harenae TaxID=657015 RepID=A0A853H0T2_9BURK|nr:LysR substrate-binding domain-containing protein [Pollutimonas harenae]NYT85932.1 LysR family transcriptional regulator [Pollutimonas harenae]TEA70984.1 LysR family transcriptional regulator [Pollutimonas harenae]